MATNLRASGAADLPTYVAGPLVVLDVDTGAIDVHCGVAATQVAQGLGAKLADPSRTEPHCRPSGASFTCAQFGRAKDFVIIDLEDPDQPHLTSAIIGSWPPTRRLGSQMSQLKAQVATATCP